jgi:hypothetical protein
VKKQPQQSKQALPAFQECLAVVPVKISIGHGDAVLKEYEDEIDLEFTDHTAEGMQNIRQCLMLMRTGYTTEEAIFKLASDAVAAQAKEITAQVHLPTYHEIHLHVKRNGGIRYAQRIE